VIQKRYKNTTLYYIPICCVKYQGVKGPQQQLIYLQIWLSARFNNRYLIACKYFRSVECKYIWFHWRIFLIVVLLAWVWLSTRASCLLHKCHENITIHVLKASGCWLAWLLFSISQRCHWVSLVNIRLLPSSTSDNTKFLRYGFT